VNIHLGIRNADPGLLHSQQNRPEGITPHLSPVERVRTHLHVIINAGISQIGDAEISGAVHVLVFADAPDDIPYDLFRLEYRQIIRHWDFFLIERGYDFRLFKVTIGYGVDILGINVNFL
jgi:hypothetical protein